MADVAEPLVFPAARRLKFGGGEHLLVAFLAVFVLLLAVWPLGRLFAEALGSGESGRSFGLIREAMASPSVWRAFWNTLETSSASVAVSVVLGVPLALAISLLEIRTRVALTFLTLSPLLIPSQIMALAWIELMGSSSPVLGLLGLAPAPGEMNPLYSRGGIVWLMGVEHMPLVFLAVRASLTTLPEDLVEAARIGGAGTLRIVTGVLLPLTAPAVVAGASLAFAASVGNFGVPALLGIPGRYPMLTTLIYQRLNGFGPAVIGQVAVLALVLVALAGVALGLRAAVLRRAVPIDRSGRSLVPFDAGRFRWPIVLLLWGAVTMLAVVPLLALFGAALSPAVGVRLTPDTLTLAGFRSTLIDSATVRRAFVNSFLLSAGAAFAAAGIAVGLAYLGTVRRLKPVRWVAWFAEVPFIVPGTVLALAYILVFLPRLPVIGVSIYGSATILLLAYISRFLALAIGPVQTTLAGLDPNLDEMGRILGAGTFRRILILIVPLAAPAAAAGAILVFMTAFNELTVSALLWSSGVETIGVMVFSLQYEGNSTAAAALSVASIGFVLILVLLVDCLGSRLPAGTLPWRS